MRRLFGWGQKEETPSAPPPSLNEASSRAGGRVDEIEGKIKKIDAQLIPMRAQLKKNPRNTMLKSRAMTLMRQKKMLETRYQQSINQQFNIDNAKYAQESMVDTKSMVEAIKSSNEAMKDFFAEDGFDIDDIMDTMDDMGEMMDMNNEIQEIMSESYGVPDDLDEDDLMDELDMLEADMAEDEALGIGGAEPDYLSVKPLATPGANVAPQGELDEFGLPMAQPQPAQPMAQ
eukprot:TRINITY_DN813_c0_g1_i5.p1 TRINITY_DN813_c0_g1~~TRINITY_DN813_c0_g1_i5.p1  ORF type:complete len:231 (-),score=56.97 TRINITY_DN813_c0_g1_i5:417-1109(-)